MIKKIFINCFLILWFAVMFIDAAPTAGQWHRDLENKLDPVLDVTGLWQGSWQLFAPSPDSMNSSIQAYVTFTDGEKVVWESPKWREHSAWERFLLFREAEYIDNVRRDTYSKCWEPLSDYLYRTVPHPTNPELKPRSILLNRTWVYIQAPNEENLKQFPETPPEDGSFAFYAKDY